MEICELMDLMNNLEENLKASPPVFNSFRTEVGKQFEKNFIELMEFTNISNVLSNLPYLYTVSTDFFDSFKIEEYLPYANKLFSNEHLSELEQNNLKEKLLLDLKKTIESFENNPDINENVSNYMERMNSYFFLAYFAYLDVYIKSIIDYLESNLDPILFKKLDEKIKSKKDRNDKLNIIKNTLSLIEPKEIGMILKRRSWKKSFDTLIDRRHFMAHNDPKARFEMLESKFKDATKKAKIQVNKITRKIINQFNKRDLIKKILNELKFNMLIYFTLLKIGNDCYSYLTLIDILIADYIVNKR